MKSGGGWPGEVEVEDQLVIEADPRVVDAFKAIGYSFEASVADLVDNSIDADASTVLIRFLRTGSEILSLVVVDDGHGMRAREIDRAMQFGGRRTYGADDLGMYGMGLKSASLSQAESVTVLSRAKGGKAVGRRWTDSQAKNGWRCDVVSSRFSADQLDRPWIDDLRLRPSGTVIRWDGVRDFQKASGNVESYLKRVRRDIAKHLGLQLHRFLEDGTLKLVIDAENVETDTLGPATEVKALNPFGYAKTGAKGFPKRFTVNIPEVGKLSIRAHIWPARSKLPGYKLGGGAVSSRQGFYFYRHGRLIQSGGWNGFRDDAEPHASLARVEVELPAKFENHFSIRFSKSGVDAPIAFATALRTAEAKDGTGFSEYVERAIAVYRTRTEPTLKPVLPPGKGVRSEVRKAVRSSLPVTPKESIDVVWQNLPKDRFFELDRENRRLVLNKRHRRAVLGERRATPADAPLVKTLLLMLVNDMFRTERESAIERKTIEAYQAILVAAARSEP